jgi:hypothetical protein
MDEAIYSALKLYNNLKWQSILNYI